MCFDYIMFTDTNVKAYLAEDPDNVVLKLGKRGACNTMTQLKKDMEDPTKIFFQCGGGRDLEYFYGPYFKVEMPGYNLYVNYQTMENLIAQGTRKFYVYETTISLPKTISLNVLEDNFDEETDEYAGQSGHHCQFGTDKKVAVISGVKISKAQVEAVDDAAVSTTYDDWLNTNDYDHSEEGSDDDEDQHFSMIM